MQINYAIVAHKVQTRMGFYMKANGMWLIGMNRYMWYMCLYICSFQTIDKFQGIIKYECVCTNNGQALYNQQMSIN